MPSVSKAQQRLFGAALGAKRGNPTFPAAKKIANSMSASKIKDFASNPIKAVAVKPAVAIKIKPVAVVKPVKLAKTKKANSGKSYL